MRTLLLILFLAFPGIAAAEVDGAPSQEQNAQEQNVPAEIPTSEKDFVSTINKYEKSTILAQFGEPSKRTDIKHHRTGEIIASIWHYHYLNTSDNDGAYYPTTELDFVGEKVVMVVFMNHDGEEVESQPVEPGPSAPDDGVQRLPEAVPEYNI
jgi:hypothetical protein